MLLLQRLSDRRLWVQRTRDLETVWRNWSGGEAGTKTTTADKKESSAISANLVAAGGCRVGLTDKLYRVCVIAVYMGRFHPSFFHLIAQLIVHGRYKPLPPPVFQVSAFAYSYRPPNHQNVTYSILLRDLDGAARPTPRNMGFANTAHTRPRLSSSHTPSHPSHAPTPQSKTSRLSCYSPRGFPLVCPRNPSTRPHRRRHLATRHLRRLRISTSEGKSQGPATQGPRQQHGRRHG